MPWLHFASVGRRFPKVRECKLRGNAVDDATTIIYYLITSYFSFKQIPQVWFWATESYAQIRNKSIDCGQCGKWLPLYLRIQYQIYFANPRDKFYCRPNFSDNQLMLPCIPITRKSLSIQSIWIRWLTTSKIPNIQQPRHLSMNSNGSYTMQLYISLVCIKHMPSFVQFMSN